MNKNLDRQQIIEVTLELIQVREGTANVNLREIARQAGCAHTNLYNYFDTYGDLLWASMETAGERMAGYVLDPLDDALAGKQWLVTYFSRMIEFYLQHKGWYRLIWLEALPSPRPPGSIESRHQVIARFITGMQASLQRHYETSFTRDKAAEMLHVLQCYINGEVAIFISGRGLIPDEKQFGPAVLSRCLHMTDLMVADLRESPADQPNKR